jgi:SAM-dependent methyltransferase
VAVGDARNHWEEQATAWMAFIRADRDYELFNRPSFLELLPAPGRLTLDVGCGEGRLARELVRLGHRVAAIDGSTTLARAASRATPRVPVALGDITRLPVASGSADLVVCFMVLMDVEDLDGAMRELARVLAPDGCLCVAVLHPIDTSGLFLSDDPNETFYMGEYLREMRHRFEIESRTGKRLLARVEHRPLHRYSRAFEAAGLVISEIREPVPDDVVIAEHPEFAKRRRVPEFLHILAERRCT